MGNLLGSKIPSKYKCAIFGHIGLCSKWIIESTFGQFMFGLGGLYFSFCIFIRILYLFKRLHFSLYPMWINWCVIKTVKSRGKSTDSDKWSWISERDINKRKEIIILAASTWLKDLICWSCGRDAKRSQEPWDYILVSITSLSEWPQTSHLASVGFCFLICKMRSLTADCSNPSSCDILSFKFCMYWFFLVFLL